MVRPYRCRHCDRLMRAPKQPAAEAPGHVAYGASGRCATCYQHLHNHGTLDSWTPGAPRGTSRQGRPAGATSHEPPVPPFDARPWLEQALCTQTDPEVFFPEQGSSNRAAKATCSRCPVREQCLDYALTNHELHGIWGGLSERERRRLAA